MVALYTRVDCDNHGVIVSSACSSTGPAALLEIFTPTRSWQVLFSTRVPRHRRRTASVL